MTVVSLPSDPATTDNYSLWKKDVLIWQKLTNLPKSKQGLALQYSCKINPRVHEVVVNIDPAKVECNEGFNNVLEVLDELFKVDSIEEEFKDYYIFENFRRAEGQTIADFINEFEFLYNKTKEHGNYLSDDLLGSKMIKSANLTQTQCELIKACSLKSDYKSIKATMKRTFGESTLIQRKVEISSNAASNKMKEQMLTNTCRSHGHQSNFAENSFDCINKQGKYLFDKNKRQTVPGSLYLNGRNPIDFLGRITRCNICDSVNHWSFKCPDKNMSTNKKYDIFFQSNDYNVQDDDPVVKETMGAAVLDTGAPKTCTGLNWFNQYLKMLSPDDSSSVTYHSSNVSYKLNNGPQQKATHSARFPVYIGSMKVLIEADILQQDLPLLLSNETLKRASAKINMENDEISMLGENIKLMRTSTGHFVIPLTRINIQSHLTMSDSDDPAETIKSNHIYSTFQEDSHNKCLAFHSESFDSTARSSKFNELVIIEIILYQDTPLHTGFLTKLFGHAGKN